MSGHGWARRAILTSIGVGALLASGVSRARPRIESEWRSREIVVDGSLDEWEGTLRFVEDAKLSLGIHNDAEYLYLAVYSRNPQVVRQIALRGLELKLEGKDESLHIRFPVGLAESGLRPPLQRDGDEPGLRPPPRRGGDETEDRELRGLEQDFAASLGTFLLYGSGPGESRSVATDGESGLLLRSRMERDEIRCEMRIPLAPGATRPLAVGAGPGSRITLSLESPREKRDELARGPGGAPPGGGPGGGPPGMGGGGMGPPPGGGTSGGGPGGMGGGPGGGMRGGGPGGSRGDVPSSLKLDVKVILAVEPSPAS